MFKIILPGGRVQWQMQLDDYLGSTRTTYTFKYAALPRGGVATAIESYFRARCHARKRRHARPAPPARPAGTLLAYLPKHVGKKLEFTSPRPEPGRPRSRGPPARRHARQGVQQTLPDLLFSRRTYLKEVNSRFIDRFPPVPAVRYEDFCAGSNLAEDWVYFQEVPEFDGCFRHLLLLNSFTYWDGVEADLRACGFHPKGFSVAEIVKWDLLRHSTGIDTYARFHDVARAWDKTALEGAFERPGRVPEPHHFSHYYKYLAPDHFRAFFLQLVEECVQHGIIVPRIALGDGLFFRTWAGNFTRDKAGRPTDPEASLTRHDRKFYGKGFTTIFIFAWCGARWLPVYCKTYTGSVSENRVFREVFAEFLAVLPHEWTVAAYDRGADSAPNRGFLRGRDLIDVIPARKNITYDVLVEIGPGRYFCESSIPHGMGANKFGRLYDHRAQVEAGFSPFKGVFNMKEMNRVGLAAASTHALKYAILLLLHALTAFKVNRADLLMSAKAFTRVAL